MISSAVSSCGSLTSGSGIGLYWSYSGVYFRVSSMIASLICFTFPLCGNQIFQIFEARYPTRKPISARGCILSDCTCFSILQYAMLPYSLTFDRLVFGITGANSFLTSSHGTTQRFSVAIYDGVRFNNHTAVLANSGHRSLGSFPSRASMRMRVMIIPPDLSAYPFISECPGGV